MGLARCFAGFQCSLAAIGIVCNTLILLTTIRTKLVSSLKFTYIFSVFLSTIYFQYITIYMQYSHRSVRGGRCLAASTVLLQANNAVRSPIHRSEFFADCPFFSDVVKKLTAFSALELWYG